MSLKTRHITRWISPLRIRCAPTTGSYRAAGCSQSAARHSQITTCSHTSSRGQTAIEYLTYFAFFLLVAAIFTAFVFSQSSEELNKRSQERFKSSILYVAQGVRDANNLAAYTDTMEYNITLPVITKGAGINISGDKNTGVIVGNTTIGGGFAYYYVQIGKFDIEPEQTGDNVVTISK